MAHREEYGAWSLERDFGPEGEFTETAFFNGVYIGAKHQPSDGPVRMLYASNHPAVKHRLQAFFDRRAGEDYQRRLRERAKAAAQEQRERAAAARAAEDALGIR